MKKSTILIMGIVIALLLGGYFTLAPQFISFENEENQENEQLPPSSTEEESSPPSTETSGSESEGTEGQSSEEQSNEESESPPLSIDVDIMLPVKLSEINYTGGIGIGPFGMHRGNHVEGLDHVWFSVNKGTVVRAPADGTVIQVVEREPGDFYVVIRHNEYIYSYLDHLKNVSVSVNDEVVQGQPIGYPREDLGSTGHEIGFDWGLTDTRVTYGPATWITPEGSFVSPYEYLNPSNKSAVEHAYYVHKQLPYLENKTIVGDFVPAEPYLTNEIFLHKGHEGEIYGVWFIKDQPWAFGGMPEIIALKLCENNPFYNGTYFAFWDGESNYGYNTYGNFTIDFTKDPHWITFTTTEGTIYYGIFKVNESGDRPTLLLEFNESSRPSDFTSNAVLYTLRSRLNPRWEKPSETKSIKMQQEQETKHISTSMLVKLNLKTMIVFFEIYDTKIHYQRIFESIDKTYIRH